MLSWAGRMLKMGNSSSQMQEPVDSDDTWDSASDNNQPQGPSQRNFPSSPPEMNKAKNKRKRTADVGEDGKSKPKKRSKKINASETGAQVDEAYFENHNERSQLGESPIKSSGKVKKGRKSKIGLEPQSIEQAESQAPNGMDVDQPTRPQSRNKKKSQQTPATEAATDRTGELADQDAEAEEKRATEKSKAKQRSRKTDLIKPTTTEGSAEDDIAGDVSTAVETAKASRKSSKDGGKRRQTMPLSTGRIVDSDSEANGDHRQSGQRSTEWGGINEQQQRTTKRKPRLSTQSEPGVERAASVSSKIRGVRKAFPCPVAGCTQTRDREARLERHVKSAHPDYVDEAKADAQDPVTPPVGGRARKSAAQPDDEADETRRDDVVLPHAYTDGPKSGHYEKEEINLAEAVFKATCDAEQISAHELKSRISQWKDVRVFKDNLAESLPNRTTRSRREFSQRHWHIGERGKWSTEEDEALRDTVVATPGQWAQLGRELERPPSDCASRWKNALQRAETRNVGPWSASEIRRLEKAVEECVDGLKASDEVSDAQKDDREYLEANLNWTLVAEKFGNTREPRRCRTKWAELKTKDGVENEDKETTNKPWSRRGSEPGTVDIINTRDQLALRMVKEKFGRGDLYDCMLEIYKPFTDPDDAFYDDEGKFWTRITLANPKSKFNTRYRRAAYFYLYNKGKHIPAVRDAVTVPARAKVLARFIQNKVKKDGGELSHTFAGDDGGAKLHQATPSRSRPAGKNLSRDDAESDEDLSRVASSLPQLATPVKAQREQTEDRSTDERSEAHETKDNEAGAVKSDEEEDASQAMKQDEDDSDGDEEMEDVVADSVPRNEQVNSASPPDDEDSDSSTESEDASHSPVKNEGEDEDSSIPNHDSNDDTAEQDPDKSQIQMPKPSRAQMAQETTHSPVRRIVNGVKQEPKKVDSDSSSDESDVGDESAIEAMTRLRESNRRLF